MRESFAGAAAYQFSKRRFGGPTAPRQRAVTVNTTLGELLPENPLRVAWLAINRSVNNGALGFDNETTFANGFLLGAGGGFASMDVETDGEAVAYRVVAINDAAAGTWRVIEIVLLREDAGE